MKQSFPAASIDGQLWTSGPLSSLVTRRGRLLRVPSPPVQWLRRKRGVCGFGIQQWGDASVYGFPTSRRKRGYIVSNPIPPNYGI